jgi:tRNA (Thr-GGU) A37 N-methylase
VSVESDGLTVRGMDCLDGTPLLDIKPDPTLFTPIAPRQSGDDEVG